MAKGHSSTRWLAGLLIGLGMLELGLEVARLYRLGLAGTSSVSLTISYTSLLLSAVAGVATLAMLSIFWVRGSRQPGGVLFLLAFLSAALSVALTWGFFAVVSVVTSHTPGISHFALPWLSVAGPILWAVARALFAAGVIRSRIAPKWIGWLGVASAALTVAASPYTRIPHAAELWIGALSVAVTGLFYIALGISLSRAQVDEDASATPTWLITAVVGATLVGLIAVCTWGGVVAGRGASVEIARSQPHFSEVFADLFPGFSAGANAPSLDGGEAHDELVQFDIKRGGNAVMPVQMAHDRSLFSPEGPAHGGALVLKVPGQPTWWVTDGYFIDHKDSAFAKTPRPIKYALWDAFVAEETRHVRILGVFPVSELKDRSLLAPYGYTAPMPSGAMVVIYTPEFDSAINEEMPWSTVDELIRNGRDYEKEFQAGAADATHLLEVRAFVRENTVWSPVHRDAAPGPIVY